MKKNYFINLTLQTTFFISFFFLCCQNIIGQISENSPQSNAVAISSFYPYQEKIKVLDQLKLTFDRDIIYNDNKNSDENEDYKKYLDNPLKISITPQIECNWKWISNNSIVCNIDSDNAAKQNFQTNQKYNLFIAKGSRIKGTNFFINEDYLYSFTNTRNEFHAQINKWYGEVLPEFLVESSTPMNKKEIEQRMYFSYHNLEKSHSIAAEVEILTINRQNHPNYKNKGIIKNNKKEEQRNKEKTTKFLLRPTIPLAKSSKIDLLYKNHKTGKIQKITSFRTYGDRPAIKGFLCNEIIDNSEWNKKRLNYSDLEERNYNENYHHDIKLKCNLEEGHHGIVLLFTTPIKLDDIKNSLSIEEIELKNTEQNKQIIVHDHDEIVPDFLPDQNKNFAAFATFATKYKIINLHPNKKYRIYKKKQLNDIFNNSVKIPQIITFNTTNNDQLNVHHTSQREYLNFENQSIVLNRYDISKINNVYMTLKNVGKFNFEYNALYNNRYQFKKSLDYVLPNIVNNNLQINLDLKNLLPYNSGFLLGEVTIKDPILDNKTNITNNLDTNKNNLSYSTNNKRTKNLIDIESTKKTKNLFIQITPFSIYAKVTAQNTMVWVVDSHTMQPVEDANVYIIPALQKELITNQNPQTQDSSYLLSQWIKSKTHRTQTNHNGIAFLPGYKKAPEILSQLISKFDFSEKESIELPHNLASIYVYKEGEMGLLPINQTFTADESSIISSILLKTTELENNKYLKSWGYTDKLHYQVGEDIKYKIYVQQQNFDKEFSNYEAVLLHPNGHRTTINWSKNNRDSSHNKNSNFHNLNNSYFIISDQYNLAKYLSEGIYHIILHNKKNNTYSTALTFSISAKTAKTNEIPHQINQNKEELQKELQKLNSLSFNKNSLDAITTNTIENNFKDTGKHRKDIKITADKEKYNIGDVATYKITNIIPNSNILFTVENTKDGILKSSLHKVQDTQISLPLPILKEYSPEILVSALTFTANTNTGAPNLNSASNLNFENISTLTKINHENSNRTISISNLKNSYDKSTNLEPLIKIKLPDVFENHEYQNYTPDLTVAIMNEAAFLQYNIHSMINDFDKKFTPSTLLPILQYIVTPNVYHSQKQKFPKQKKKFLLSHYIKNVENHMRHIDHGYGHDHDINEKEKELYNQYNHLHNHEKEKKLQNSLEETIYWETKHSFNIQKETQTFEEQLNIRTPSTKGQWWLVVMHLDDSINKLRIQYQSFFVS